MGKSIIILLITLLLGLTLSVNNKAYANTEQLVGFEAEYVVYRFGRSLGKAKLSLKTHKDKLYRLDYNSKVSAFFLSDVRSETSIFSYENAHVLQILCVSVIP